MSDAKNARVGLIALAFAVVALVVVLVWRFRGGDSAKESETHSAKVQNETDTKGGNEAMPPPRVHKKLPPPLGGESLHDRIGGRPGIRVLTDRLLDVVTQNEDIMANENARRVNVRVLQGHLIDLLCKETGGQCEYTPGAVKDALGGVEITAAQWDALEKDFAAVIAEMDVPDKEAQELTAVLDALGRAVVAGQ